MSIANSSKEFLRAIALIVMSSWTLPLFFFADSNNVTCWACVLCALFVVIVDTVVTVKLSNLSFLQPKIAIHAMFFLLFCARPIVVLAQGNSIDEEFTLAELIALWSILAFILGHSIITRKHEKKTVFLYKTVWHTHRLYAVTLIYFAVSIVSISSFVLSSGSLDSFIQSLSSYKTTFEGAGYAYAGMNICKISSYVWLVKDLTSRKKVRLITIALLVATVLLSLFGGSRTNIISFIAMIFITFALVKRRKSLRYLAFAVVIILLVVVQYRFAFRGSENTGVNNLGTVASQSVFRQDAWDKLMDKGNFGMLDTFAEMIAYRKDRKLPLEWGMTYLAILTQPLPRKHFPNKLAGGGETVTKALNPGMWKMGSGYHFSVIGELYLNWDVVGSILGMLFIGFFSRRFGDRILSQSSDVLFIGIYSISLFRFSSLMKGEFLAVATGWAIEIGLFAVTMLFVTKRRKYRDAEQSI